MRKDFIRKKICFHKMGSKLGLDSSGKKKEKAAKNDHWIKTAKKTRKTALI